MSIDTCLVKEVPLSICMVGICVSYKSTNTVDLRGHKSTTMVDRQIIYRMCSLKMENALLVYM